MMVHEIKIPDSIKLDSRTTVEWLFYLQLMTNRRCVGALRYGDTPKATKKYLSRLSKELQVYRKTGNMENLLNVAVYSFLESMAPQNKKFHFNPTVDSATRKIFGL